MPPSSAVLSVSLCCAIGAALPAGAETLRTVGAPSLAIRVVVNADLEALRRAAAADATDAKAHFALGNALKAARQWEEALSAYHGAVVASSDDPVYRQGFLTLAELMGKDAFFLVEVQAKTFPDQMAYQVLYANGLWDGTRRQDAAQVYRQLLKRQPKHALAYLWLERAKRAELSAEVQRLRAHLRQSPHDRSAQLKLIPDLVELGEAEQAYALAQLAVSQRSRDAASLAWLASTAAELKVWPVAIDAGTRALAIDRHQVRARQALKKAAGQLPL